ncbi:PIN domain-containing protein [Svornostia abyssi]|uniref:PIN domain-containing protein n=1 Tax=Svornostia abyssi TaxID=2898438 RepID=A0ABY5PHE9_9ACTN|nr:PIN domain-containing protein [Parviterribacteraceae bacterium J379]
MPAVYLDTSAVGRVLLGEPDAGVILAAIGAFDQRVASRLMRVELRRLALREGVLADADQLLAGVALVPLDDDLLAVAETLPPSTVATLDALHLATAVRLAAAGMLDAVMTYDHRLADGARQHGLEVLAPA